MNKFIAKHRIFREVGPFGIALVLVFILLFSPLNVTPKYSQKQLKTFAANPWSRSNFVGYSIKSQAFGSRRFLPILGSSELEHFDAFHPSVWSEKYNTSWTPFLAGKPGTQSLTQFFYVNSMAKTLKNQKIVFIISPQWFKPQGIPIPALENFTSKGELYNWLATADAKDVATQNLALRMLHTKSGFNDDLLIKNAEQTLAKGEKLNFIQKSLVGFADQFWKKEDLLFSFFSTQQKNQDKGLKKVQHFSKQLPNHPTTQKLERVAYHLGEKAANNNRWQINNKVWDKRKGFLLAQKNQKMTVSYLSSPEYADFQQLLNQFAANHNDVQFIIQPVNGAWSDYTNVPYRTMEAFAVKIKEQLSEQGFTHVLDLTDKYDEPYYSGDTIHLGTRGWLAVDQTIDQFVKTPNQTKYQIDNTKFLSKEWSMDKK